MKKQHLVYKTICIHTNEFYIGIHSTSNINDGYLGSGDVIKRKIKKYGKQSFIREILFIFNTRSEALLKESEIVTEELISDALCMNITIGGKGNSCPKSYNSPESNLKRSITLTGQKRPDRQGVKLSEEHRYKISKKLQGRIPHNKGVRTPEHIKQKMRGRIPHNKGEEHTLETKQKISNSIYHDSKKRMVSVDGISYASISEVMHKFNMHRSTVIARLNSVNFPNWEYINTEEDAQ